MPQGVKVCPPAPYRVYFCGWKLNKVLTTEMLLRTNKVFILDDIYVDKDSPSQKKNIQQMLKHSAAFQDVERLMKVLQGL